MKIKLGKEYNGPYFVKIGNKDISYFSTLEAAENFYNFVISKNGKYFEIIKEKKI